MGIRVSVLIINKEIDAIENVMFALDKKFLKTSTLRQRIAQYYDEPEEVLNREFQKEGVTHIIQSCLYNRDYRCIRPGIFVNLGRCDDIEVLQELENKADISVDDKARVRDRIRDIKNEKLSGQAYFNENMEIIVPINEEQFMERILAEAV